MRGAGGEAVRPKIVASTATVRQAQDQVQALFGRSLTRVFPAPGPDRRDSFFARTESTSRVPGRTYVGIAAQGRNPKVVMRRAWLALMGAAQKAHVEAGGRRNEENPADPYMTVLGYFNSLKELGGARRILEEEVRNTIKRYGTRRRIGETAGLFRDRRSFSEVVELTSRVSTDKVAEARRRLERRFHESDRVDCAIATNMISVGLDIPRLGLMVVLGQPLRHDEYIQATSRIGRDDDRPGLVVSLLNIHKPRDRSHYERFRHYHETFYRSVEVGSVTPFSARALDRGFAGALVSLARHGRAGLTPALGVQRIGEFRAELERLLLDAFLERVRQQPIADEEERDQYLRNVQNRIVDLLDSWSKVIDDYQSAGVDVQYQRYDNPETPAAPAAASGDPGQGLRNRASREVPGQPLPEGRGAQREPLPGEPVNRAHGQIRSSQVITSYGPGALIDLPHDSAIVGGLDTWPRTGDLEEIHEPRLERKVRNLTDVTAPRLYAPPPESTDPSQRVRGIGALRFPEWFVVQEGGGDGDRREQSRRLVHRKALDPRQRFDGHEVVATRFVRACPKGHVDDLDWWYFVHEGEPPLQGAVVAGRAQHRGRPGGPCRPLRMREVEAIVRGDAAGDESPRFLPGSQALAGAQCQRGLRSAEPAADPDGFQRLVSAGGQRALPSGSGKRRRAGGAGPLGRPVDRQGCWRPPDREEEAEHLRGPRGFRR